MQCPSRCPAAHRRRAKEYSRLKMGEERAWQQAMSTKLRLKREALAALPERLRAAAEVPDLEPFPLTRAMWSETPPLEEGARDAAKAAQPGKRAIGTKRR